MTRRYYVADLLAQVPLVTLPQEEAAHAINVMRIAGGEMIELFDGRSHQCAAEVIDVDRRRCVVRCDPPQIIDREPSVSLDLFVSLPKPDRAKELIERLTELGVGCVWPITCHRTQRPPSASGLEKLRRVVIESCKQSGRNQLMEIKDPQTFDSMLATAEVDLDPKEVLRWVAMPGGSPSGRQVSAIDRATPATLHVMVGPEGGLTDDENQRLVESGWIPVGLGERILRIETAAVAIASMVLID